MEPLVEACLCRWTHRRGKDLSLCVRSPSQVPARAGTGLRSLREESASEIFDKLSTTSAEARSHEFPVLFLEKYV